MRVLKLNQSRGKLGARVRLAAGLVLLVPALQAKDLVDYVNPFIGAGSMEGIYKGAIHGKNFPGAATPGGMVQLSPDTINGGDNGGGYSYVHKTVDGFSVNHLSGVGWHGDLGNFLVTPTTGPLRTHWGETDKPGSGYLSTIDKATEVAKAGYYAVTLSDYGVRAEMTAAPHSGILRFTFPEKDLSRIQIDLARRIGGTSLHQSMKVVNDTSIEGEIVCTPDGGGWGHGAGKANFTVYYHAEFSRPLDRVGVWSATLPPGPYRNVLRKPEFITACREAKLFPGCREMEGQHLGFYSEFPTKAGEVVLLKVGISYVDIEGARANLRAEIPDWNFDEVRQKASEAWSRELQRVRVEGGTEAQKTAFYTAIYHALIDPRILADVNGNYPGGDGKPHVSFTKRTVFSGWDVYRSQFPLLTIIEPSIVNDAINSWVELAEQNGSLYFDRWELLNAYSGCMNGNPAIIALNDAWQKGIRNYDVAKAFQFAVNTAERTKNGPDGYTPGDVSATFEIALADWNLARLAQGLGHNAEGAKFLARSLGYRQLFDPSAPWTYDREAKVSRPEWKGWFRVRGKDGSWNTWEGLLSHTGCTEGSLYQWGWHAPHDIPGLMQLLGGRELFVAKLSDFFDRTPKLAEWNDFANPSNEPSHLIPFQFNRAGAPWLTQKWVRRICTETYGADYDGLCGDEDEGQMSAWYVLAASGIHPACPGDTRYEIFTPLFDRVQIRIGAMYGKERTFTVTARGNGPGDRYIQSATLNGCPLERCWMEHSEIVAGGKLELELGPEPSRWGVNGKALP